MKFMKWATFLAVILTVSTFIFYKPSRVLIPEMNGVDCATKSICIDDISRLEEAEELIAHAVIEMEDVLGQLKNYPKAVFCSTQECFEKFGFKHAAARAVGKSALVIGPRGWKPHYIKHEIVHYWQAENIGIIKMLLMDDWLIEGMAYALSDDPRPELEQPWQSYRTKFTEWYKTVDQDTLVLAIKQLE